MIAICVARMRKEVKLFNYWEVEETMAKNIRLDTENVVSSLLKIGIKFELGSSKIFILVYQGFLAFSF